MRKDGIDLTWTILVAEVGQRKALSADDWSRGFFGIMPLPGLELSDNPKRRDYAINFDNLYTVSPEQLTSADRIAALSPIGINLLLQRWVHYSSRVVVPSFTFNEVTAPFCEEADLIEEWCEQSASDETPTSIRAAGKECMEWLREEHEGGKTYQQMLKDPQSRSTVRRKMRTELKSRM